MSVLRPISGKVKRKIFEKLRNIIVSINGHYKKVEDLNTYSRPNIIFFKTIILLLGGCFTRMWDFT